VEKWYGRLGSRKRCCGGSVVVCDKYTTATTGTTDFVVYNLRKNIGYG